MLLYTKEAMNMTLKVHKSASRIRARRARLLALQPRVQQQINDADCLIAMLEEYCRENPDDCACAANEPTWQQQLSRQREDLVAMLLAIREKLKKYEGTTPPWNERGLHWMTRRNSGKHGLGGKWKHHLWLRPAH
jgi:hypothetical protein